MYLLIKLLMLVSTYLVSRILFPIAFVCFLFLPHFALITVPAEAIKHSGLYGHERRHTHFEWYWIELISARSWELRQLCILVLIPTQRAWRLKYYIHKFRIPFQGSKTSVSYTHCCSKSKSTVFLFWRYPKPKNQEHQFISLLPLEIQFGQTHESPVQKRVKSCPTSPFVLDLP